MCFLLGIHQLFARIVESRAGASALVDGDERGDGRCPGRGPMWAAGEVIAGNVAGAHSVRRGSSRMGCEGERVLRQRERTTGARNAAAGANRVIL